jgi:hypothetical protein
MSPDANDVQAAASRLTNAMSELVRAIDAVGDEGAAAKDIPEELTDQLERLLTRLNAAQGFSA